MVQERAEQSHSSREYNKSEWLMHVIQEALKNYKRAKPVKK